MASEFCNNLNRIDLAGFAELSVQEPYLTAYPGDAIKGEFVEYKSDRQGDAQPAEEEEQATPVGRPVGTDQVALVDRHPDSSLPEQLDPRIEEKIIMLSDAATALNYLQGQLWIFRSSSAETELFVAGNLKNLGRELGRCVLVSAPYFKAQEQLRLAENQLQETAFSYARAQSRMRCSREKIDRLQEDLLRAGGTEDVAVLVLLNFLTSNYVTLHREAVLGRLEHAEVSRHYTEIQETVSRLKVSLGDAVKDAKPYYELQNRMNCVLQEDRLYVMQMEEAVSQAKEIYGRAEKGLEDISQQIHDRTLLRKN